MNDTRTDLMMGLSLAVELGVVSERKAREIITALDELSEDPKRQEEVVDGASDIMKRIVESLHPKQRKIN